MQSTRTCPKIIVAGGARGVVGHAGARLLTDLADKTGLTSGFVYALGLDRVRRPAHEPGRVAVDLALTGIDLLCWTQHLLLDGSMAAAEPKKLRYRLLHVAAKLTRTARTTTLRIAAEWPWTDDLIRAFERLAALPEPVT